MAKTDLTAQRLRELLHYDPETGDFTSLVATGSRLQWKAGRIVGFTKSDGYKRIRVEGKVFASHRMAWLYMTGSHPKESIDHMDGDPGNNRWANLRPCDQRLNCENRRIAQANSKSGFLGVTLKPSGRFQSVIKDGDRTAYLGTFATPEEAHQAYIEAKRRLHPGCTI